jgi:hypothetical protein
MYLSDKVRQKVNFCYFVKPPAANLYNTHIFVYADIRRHKLLRDTPDMDMAQHFLILHRIIPKNLSSIMINGISIFTR